MVMPRPICFMFERQLACRAFSRAWAKTGNKIAARIAIIAITTRSSISVKPHQPRLREVWRDGWCWNAIILFLLCIGIPRGSPTAGWRDERASGSQLVLTQLSLYYIIAGVGMAINAGRAGMAGS